MKKGNEDMKQKASAKSAAKYLREIADNIEKGDIKNTKEIAIIATRPRAKKGHKDLMFGHPLILGQLIHNCITSEPTLMLTMNLIAKGALEDMQKEMGKIVKTKDVQKQVEMYIR